MLPLPHTSIHRYAPAGVVDINVVVGIEVPVKDQTLKLRVQLSPTQCISEHRSKYLVKGPCQVNEQHDPSRAIKSRQSWLRNSCGIGSFLEFARDA